MNLAFNVLAALAAFAAGTLWVWSARVKLPEIESNELQDSAGNRLMGSLDADSAVAFQRALRLQGARNQYAAWAASVAALFQGLSVVV